MDTLGDIAGDRVVVECLTCRRRGEYRLVGLLASLGHATPQLDVLRHLTASCRHQKRPGSPPVRKYESVCQARILLPAPSRRVVETPIHRGLNIEVWKDSGTIEWHLATVWSFDLGREALDAASRLYPDREVTLRQDCRVIAKRGKSDEP